MGKWDAIEKRYVLEQFFEKGIEEATVVPKQILQSLIWSECDLEVFDWIRTVGFVLQCCSEKNLIKNWTLQFVLVQLILLFREQ